MRMMRGLPTLVLVACLTGCTVDDAPEAGGSTRSASELPTPTSSSSPTSARVIQPLPAMPLDLSGRRRISLGVDVHALADGSPARVPWVEYDGNPEQGRARFLNVGARRVPLTGSGYLSQVAVWRTGVVGQYGDRSAPRAIRRL